MGQTQAGDKCRVGEPHAFFFFFFLQGGVISINFPFRQIITFSWFIEDSDRRSHFPAPLPPHPPSHFVCLQHYFKAKCTTNISLAIGWLKASSFSKSPDVCLATGIPSELLSDVTCDVRGEVTQAGRTRLTDVAKQKHANATDICQRASWEWEARVAAWNVKRLVCILFCSDWMPAICLSHLPARRFLSVNLFQCGNQALVR